MIGQFTTFPGLLNIEKDSTYLPILFAAPPKGSKGGSFPKRIKPSLSLLLPMDGQENAINEPLLILTDDQKTKNCVGQIPPPHVMFGKIILMH